jgi:UDP-N-acetylmuramate--alanine ligase
MIDTGKISGFFFVGIGGIGMSALARYFAAGGFAVAGYDRTGSELTDEMAAEGCTIQFSDVPEELPELFRDPATRENVIVVVTPAIPSGNKILSFFRENSYRLYKRSEILGAVSQRTDTIGVAGTHGKTTVSTILAHILKISHLDCSAFLGGISKNYNTNLILGDSRFTVIEADEYDRSFLRLEPLMAIVTSTDADHLDIYGDHATMIDAYNDYCSKVRPGGSMIVNKKIEALIHKQTDVSYFTYGIDETADFSAINVMAEEHFYRFDLKTPSGIIRDIHFSFPGLINVENAVAASTAALLNGVMEEELRKALICFMGVRRRFDVRIRYPEIVYIDDYAHHPEEIKACIDSVREQYAGRHITAVFQPHLFSRTRDHAAAFASALDVLDKVILMPVYPAREEPIPGVSSEMILSKMKLKGTKVIDRDAVLSAIDFKHTDLLLTIGAGDIDRLVKPIEEMIKSIYRK